jgi:hypothetical protein
VESDERRAAPLREVTATRFVVAWREGGSLPGVIEGDDGCLWVTKFRGADGAQFDDPEFHTNSGVCCDPEATLDRSFFQLVGR